MSDADKASLAQKPVIYRHLIQFCRVACIIMALGCVLLFAAQGLGRGRDCDYGSRGEHCYPG